MAYVDQAKKARIAAEVKKVMPAGWKYSLAVRNHSTIVCTITAAPVDLVGEWVRAVNANRAARNFELLPATDHADVNCYHLDTQFDESLETIRAIVDALNTENFDKRDLQSDYVHVGHYVDLNIGRWNVPFRCTRLAYAA